MQDRGPEPPAPDAPAPAPAWAEPVPASPWGPDQVPDLVLMAGQSNMRGYKVAPGPLQVAAAEALGDAVHILCGDSWQPLRHGAGYQHRGFGPEMGFAAEWIARTGRPLAIVKVAQNATWLERQWHPSRPDALFRMLVDRARLAMASHQVRLAGLLWMQGEADALTPEAAGAYDANFTALVDRLRLELGAPDLPVMAGLPNPDPAEFPHLDQVRTALRDCPRAHVHVVDTEGLTRKPDRLHYDGPALDELGRRFARTMAENPPPRPPAIRRWLWCDDRYHCWSEFETTAPAEVMVSLPHAVADSGFDEPAFAQSFLRKNAISAIYVRMGKSNWFQDDRIFPLAERIRAHAGTASVAVYGASMGGYGALLLSGALRADTVISVAPQYSIDRGMVPFETRWRKAAGRIGPFLHQLAPNLSPDAAISVLYDPRSRDRQQVELLPQAGNIRLIPIPHASHQVLQRLLEGRALPLLVENAFARGPSAARIIAAARDTRRDSKTYWMTLADAASARRPALALRALARALDCGGPPRKIRRMREAIQKAHPDLTPE